MARVLITGLTAGLGQAAARQLLDGGHEVVLHARNSGRAAVWTSSLVERLAWWSAISQAPRRRAAWRIR